MLAYTLVLLCAAGAFASADNYESFKQFIQTGGAELEAENVYPDEESPATPSNTPHLLGAKFSCNVQTSPSTPTSVHQLRPSDIKAVGALGDSLTAALEADALTLLEITQEWRGLSWSAGGDSSYDSDVTTLPNILKKFNPSVSGFSTGKCTAKEACPTQGFNVAVTGAIAADLPGQADVLISSMKASTAFNFNNDWKMVTIFIGGNDLCRMCNGDPNNEPANYISFIEQAIDKIVANVPRVFINLVSIFDVSRLNEVTYGLCPSLHKQACPCLYQSDAWAAQIIADATEMAVCYCKFHCYILTTPCRV